MLRASLRCGYGQKNYPIHSMKSTSDTHKIKARIAEILCCPCLLFCLIFSFEC